MQKRPEPLKSKGLRDSSLFSAVVLIVEKGWISMRSRQMGAYQHTKSNGHTIPEMNRVTVKWERVIVYQESCDSRLFHRSGLFSALFGPTCRLQVLGWVRVQPRLLRGNRGGRVGKQCVAYNGFTEKIGKIMVQSLNLCDGTFRT